MKSDKPYKIEHSLSLSTPCGAGVGPVCDYVPKNERVSTRQTKERFVAIFEAIGGSSITVASRQADVSRDTYYRWLKEDQDFKNRIDSIQTKIHEFVEDILMKKIFQGDGPSVRFYLSRKHPDYKTQKGVHLSAQWRREQSLKELAGKLNAPLKS